jgi:hypothetical protein
VALGVSSASAADRPSLHLVADSPKVVVRGLAFHARERVTVRLIGRTTTQTTMLATAAGSFRVTLVRPDPLACGRLFVVAKGSAKSWATLRIGPPECNPPEGQNR